MDPELEEYDWLLSPAAAAYIVEAAGPASSLVSLTESLRRRLGASRADLVIKQAQLRHRARRKFSRAGCMFFTARLLEQATDERIANYKASRFQADSTVADLCCGLGGDLLGIAARGPAVGVDQNPVATKLAAANCQAQGIQQVRLATADAARYDVAAFDAWHIDPDRRPGGKRTIGTEFFQPDVRVLRRLLALNPDGAIKLAPATPLPGQWLDSGEAEWIGSRRECRQQVFWHGNLARHAGQHTATAIAAMSAPASFSGRPDVDLPAALDIGPYVYEPHPAVLAARLAGALGEHLSMAFVATNVAYFTSSVRIANPLLSGFEVLDVLPFDIRRLKAAVRQRHLGRLEVKVRGAHVDPEQLRRKLRVPGDESATLLIAGRPSGSLALLARRPLPNPDSS